MSDINWIAVANSISQERLARYRRSDSDIRDALLLYERNTLLSEAFYTSLQGLEICFRNKLHACLERDFCMQCLLQNKLPLISEDVSRLSLSKSSLYSSQKQLTEGSIVAELSLGFWVKLLGPTYDATLWRTSLFRAFSSKGRYLRRKGVHGRFNAIRRFRNRIAHHEPIWDQDVVGRHAEIIEAISWMCGDTALWVDRRSRLPHLAVIP